MAHEAQDIAKSCMYTNGANTTKDSAIAIPRSCRSCLQTAGCMVNQFGLCVDYRESDANPAMHFSHALAGDPALLLLNANENATTTTTSGHHQAWQFPAQEVAYCDADDAVCTRCTSSTLWQQTNDRDSRFCVGHHNCVCILNCEWSSSSPMIRGSAASLRSGAINLSDPFTQLYVLLFLAGLLVLLLCACVVRVARSDFLQERRQQTGTARRPQAVAHSTSGQALSLAGWHEYRRESLHKEPLRFSDSRLSFDTAFAAMGGATASVEYVEMEDGNQQQPVRGGPTREVDSRAVDVELISSMDTQ